MFATIYKTITKIILRADSAKQKLTCHITYYDAPYIMLDGSKVMITRARKEWR